MEILAKYHNNKPYDILKHYMQSSNHKRGVLPNTFPNNPFTIVKNTKHLEIQFTDNHSSSPFFCCSYFSIFKYKLLFSTFNSIFS